MEIEVLEPHGFCAGVSAALAKARALAASSGGRAWCLHEIVHNSIVVAELEAAGIRFVESLDEVPDGSPLLFSAHGVSPSVRAEAESRGMRIVDATCPFVARVHAAAREFARRGRRVVVVGKADHAEVKGILGEAPGSVAAGSVADAENLPLPPGSAIGVVCQTTVNSDDALRVYGALAERYDAELSGGACSATKDRQDAVKAFGGDMLLVLGSPGSSNTRRLCEVARCKTILADGMEKVREAGSSGAKRLGVTSGASTPESFFNEALAYLRRAALALAVALAAPFPGAGAELKSAGRMEDPPPGGSYASYLESPAIRKIASQTVRAEDGTDVRVTSYEWQSKHMYRLDRILPHEPADAKPVSLVFKGWYVWQPVVADLETGEILALPGDAVAREGANVVLKDVPLARSALLAPTKAVARRIVWREMSPAEIVDSIYMPWQNPQGTNKGPVKMDVSGEPWIAMPAEKFLPCFDRYGQFRWREWPGKTHSDEELKRAAEEEARDIAAHPGAPDRDCFGGWAAGPKLRATGRFRTAKYNGKWWFVDPDGRLFWSFGPVRVSTLSGVTPLNGNTRTPLCGRAMPDRDPLFEPFPGKGDPLSRFMLCNPPNGRGETRYFDFASANLYRKYGEGWYGVFAEQAHRRLASWGMNTIANASDPKICAMGKTPYTVRVSISSKKIQASWGLWSKFPDPFDESFEGSLRGELEAESAAAHDQWCIGFFVDNEVQWGQNREDLARWTLLSPASQPARKEFMRRLAAKGIEPGKDGVSGVPEEELRAFSGALAEEYFRKIRETIKAFDPDLLYLGCRFAGSSRPGWAVKIAARHCDVESFNVYRETVAGWSPGDGADKPVLIGEFHFGAHDRGLFGSGQRNALTQEGRAAAVKRYVSDALADPRIVGVHWHQYADQPAAGRFDGEHFQVGLVDICDRPYAETVEAVRETAYPMYKTRSGR